MGESGDVLGRPEGGGRPADGTTPQIVRGGDQPSSPARFEHASFRASVAGLVHTRQGDLRVTLDIPYADRHRGIPLADAFGLTLNVSVERPPR